MSEITVTLGLRQAAAVREALFRSTAQDSYEFPSQRTVEIREAIIILDEKIEETLNDSEST
tara:strand:- start:179 stop:361 length:183 start_codon:yes stop_codon:yes gene_type:complete